VDPRRSQILPTTLVAVAVPFLVVIGIFLGGHPEVLPSPLRTLLVSHDVRTTQEAYDLIHRDYFRKVSTKTLVNDGIDGAVRSLNDRFSHYLDPKSFRRFLDQSRGQFSGVGMEVAQDPRGLRVTRVFPRSPAAKVGIGPGTVVVAVEGKSIAGKPSQVSSALIRGNPGTAVRLTVLAGGRRREVRVLRARISAPSVTSKLRDVGGVKLGVDAVSGFTSGVHGELRQAIDSQLGKGARGVVLDMRDNGGGLLSEAVLVSSIFIPKGTVVSTDGRTRARKVYEATGGAITRPFKVVVLVNHDTASAAEIVTAALQERRGAKVVGTRTFGKGVFQEVEELSNGGALDITVGQYFTPDGHNLGGGGVKPGAGIAPDVPVTSPRGAKGDRALEVALRTLAAEAR
jgi:carboxyl-terminal processing protease